MGLQGGQHNNKTFFLFSWMGLILPLWYQLDVTFFQNFVQIPLPLLWWAMTDFFHWEIFLPPSEDIEEAHHFPVLHRAPCNDQVCCHLASVQEILPYPEGFTYCLIKTWVGQRADGVFGGCRVTAPGLDPVWTSRMTSQEEEDLVDKKHLYRRPALKIAYG